MSSPEPENEVPSAWRSNDPRIAFGSRAAFPSLVSFAYLNHAAISPPSEPVAETVARVLADYQRQGVAAYGTWARQRERLRAALARLLGADPRELALTSSTTRAVSDIALCYPWRAGDRLIWYQGEFPANVNPWLRAAEHYDLAALGLPLSDFDQGDAEGLLRLERALEHGVRLVAVSAVQFRTGRRMPLAEMASLCHRHGAELFCDAIQAAGVVPLDVRALGVDYLAGGAHKWLMGLEGAAYVYVASERVSALRPVVAGWLSHEQGDRFLFDGPGHLGYDRPLKQDASFLEGSSSNTLGFAALEASLEPIRRLGVEAIFAHVTAYLDRLEGELLERGFSSLRSAEASGRSGILALEPPEGVHGPELVRRLRALGVSSSLPDGHLRFSPHWPNSLAEVPEVVRAVDRALSS